MFETRFTTREAAALAGFKTAMMVDYLCRSGIVVPSKRARPGRGSRRFYAFGDVVLLRAVNRLLESGLPVSRLKAALKRIQRDFRHLKPDDAIKRYLLTNGREVFLADELGALHDLSKDGQLCFAFVVDICHARDDVKKRVQEQRYLHRKTAKA